MEVLNQTSFIDIVWSILRVFFFKLIDYEHVSSVATGVLKTFCTDYIHWSHVCEN